MRHKNQACGTCCCYNQNHSGKQCPSLPNLLLSSPPLLQLPKLPAYFHCGFASLSSPVAIFCCLWSLLLSVYVVSATSFLVASSQPALLTLGRKGPLTGALPWTQCYNASTNSERECFPADWASLSSLQQPEGRCLSQSQLLILDQSQPCLLALVPAVSLAS